MTVREARWIHRDVSPLELFFDLVFVLAVGQLTHHLIEHLTWRGAAETVVMLVAVCGVWAFTTFEVTLLDIERTGTKAVTVAVMGLGLFMNAGIANAFEDGPWLFVVPMLLALAGPGLYAMVTAPTAQLREHFVRVLVWVAISAPLWVAGATQGSDVRLWFWAAAALIDLVGTWTAHPAPGRATRTAGHQFDAEHMLERMRLFLIILLGETVIALGRVISDHHSDVLILVMALGSFVALVCLWQVYFGRAEQQVIRHTSATEDPIRSVHVGINVIYGVVTGLVVLAAGLEVVLAHAHERSAGVAGVLVLAGPLIYLVSQAVYFRVETGTGWRPRAVGAAALGAAAATAYWLPGYAVVALLVLILIALAAHLSLEAPAVGEQRDDVNGSATHRVNRQRVDIVVALATTMSTRSGSGLLGLTGGAMTVLRVCRTTMGDEERGDIVFAGALVIFPGVAGLDAFRARVDELIRAAFGVADPETAQFPLTQTDYQDTVRALQERIRKDAAARRLLLSALENTGLAVSDTYWDWIHLRVLPHGAEHAAAGTGWHRDTWASNLAAQTNWWTPIYPVTAGRTITFAPAQWSQPLANTSRDWDPHTARAQRQAPEPGRRVPMIPELVDPLCAVPELRVVIEPDDLLCFSGAHLHGSVANESGRARFSVEVRTVHRADVDQGRGAANVDGHAPQVQYRWFHHVVDGTPLGWPV